MAAVLGVLSETVTETIKAFYRLRKAYISLEQIIQEEQKHLETLERESKEQSALESTPEESLDGPGTNLSMSF
jgi:hypothetical protein